MSISDPYCDHCGADFSEAETHERGCAYQKAMHEAYYRAPGEIWVDTDVLLQEPPFDIGAEYDRQRLEDVLSEETLPSEEVPA